VAEALNNRDQMTLFALLAVARPVTNRELREIAGLEVKAETRRHLTAKHRGFLQSTKRGATNVHCITKPGRDWCLAAFSAGRPLGENFPVGVLYAVLAAIGNYLNRDDVDLATIFQPDMEQWIRSVYAELTVRRPGQYVRLTEVRKWFDGVAIDEELDRMIEQSDVHLTAILDQAKLTDADRRAAVEIGGEARHLLTIDRP